MPDRIGNAEIGQIFDISYSICNKLAPKKTSIIVNVYPQAINRDCCDKNHQSGAQKHWDTQIISQPGGVNPTF
jgi:hypothetical protein